MMWAGYGWVVWALFGGLFFFLMLRGGGCCGGHGGHGGHGNHGDRDPGTNRNETPGSH